MSWTNLGSTLVRSRSPAKTACNMVSGGVSLNNPLLALVRGVLTAPQRTTSSADFGWIEPVELSC